MCVGFIDINQACPKDLYLLPNFDRIIDDAFCYKLLSFMGVYSGYNEFKMSSYDASKTLVMANNFNYYYKVMLFGLKMQKKLTKD